MARFNKLFVILLILAFFPSATIASAQSPSVETVTNGIYSIYVQSAGVDIGTYTISTGANHPVTVETGSPQSVLYGGDRGSPGTSFNTIRSYTTNTDYVTRRSPASGFAVVNLDAYSTGTVVVGGNELQTIWELPGPPTTPDKLVILQNIRIEGDNFSNSYIVVSVEVTNLSANPVALGARYFWDVEIGFDDGPTFTQVNQDGTVGTALTRETEFVVPAFESFYIQDNDGNVNPPLFGVHGTVNGPQSFVTTAPDILQYLSWPNGVNAAFDYTIDPNRDIATNGGDSAVAYIYGPDSTKADTIGQLQTLSLVTNIFAAPPDGDLDGDGLFNSWETNDTDLNGDGVIDVGPSGGSNPSVKDIYVEVDWMEATLFHGSHKPKPEAIEKVVDSFAAQGINLHVDVGPDSIDYVTGNPWGQNSNGNEFAHEDWIGHPSNNDELKDDWNRLKSANFGHSDRVFHHALFVHKATSLMYAGNTLKGLGNRPGQHFFVSLGSYSAGSINEQAGVFMHELGHNLGLRHGGNQLDDPATKDEDDYNYKPNYLSVMNGVFTSSGFIVNGNDGYMDYSRIVLPDLKEDQLVESNGLNDARVAGYETKYYADGICNWSQLFKGYKITPVDQPINWDCDTGIDSQPVQADINGVAGNSQTLTGWDDWAHLIFKADNIGLPVAASPIPITLNDIENGPRELTFEEDLLIQRISDPRVQLSKTVDVLSVQPGGAVTYTITMFNIDAQDVNGVVVTDTLPAGFSYVIGTTSGATTADPVINGQDLSWISFIVPANGGELTLTFQATAAQVPGTYFNNVNGSSTNGYVVPTEDTAEVEVVSTPTACTPSNSYGQLGSGYHLASLNSAPLLANFERLPLSFVPNRGQEDGAVKFNAKGLGGNLFFTPSEVVFSLPNPVKVKEKEDEKEKIRYDLHPANVVRIHYQGANENPEVVGLGELPGVVNVLKGNNPSKWRANLPTYSGIAYRELYPGVELRYEGTDGTLKSTFHVAPGADPSAIIWRYKGVDSLSADEAGNLVVNLPEPAGNGAVMIEQAPVAWQVVNDNRVMVAVQYAVEKNDKKVSFTFPNGYDSTLPLVIDPTITYSAYLGGGKTDEAYGITVDGECNLYVTGATSSSNFPTEVPIQGNQPTKDIFISKLNPAGDTLLFSTYLGGDESDQAAGILLDSQGRITIVGESESSDFPTLNAYASSRAAGTCGDGEPCDDVVVAQLTPDGAALRYSTYLGGGHEDDGLALAIGPDDKIYVTGSTRSSNFPTVNAYDSSFGGGTCSNEPCNDVFVAAINPALTGTASLLYSTFLGGNNYDVGTGIAADSAGHVYVTGYARSSGFPTLNAYQSSRTGSVDAFITKLDTSLSGSASLLYSTYLGGSEDDRAFGLALHGTNQVYLTGYTRSPNFPRANAFDDLLAGTCGTNSCYDAFVSHLDIGTNVLAFSSFLGGSNDDEGAGITVDASGNIFLTGNTISADFQTLAAMQPQKGADSCASPPCADAFVTKVSAAGTLTYSTYLGGSWEDYGNAILVDGLGNTYIAGYTFSSDLPTPITFPYVGGSGYSDAFVVKIED